MRKTVQVKLRLKIITVIIILVFVLGVFLRYESWWTIFLAFGLTIAFSSGSIFYYKNHLELQRQMRYGWAKVGDVLEERIIVRNNGLIPAHWIEIQDHTDMPDRQKAIGTSVDVNNSSSWKIRHVCTRRGLYRLGPTTVHTSDLFGFFQLTIHDPTSANILITPPVLPLPSIEVASGGRAGDGRFSKGVMEQSVAVSTVRDYHPEDPLHHIHWPLSVKHNQLTTRVFENTPTGNWWIIQDMNQAVQVGDTQTNSLEVGIILSASLAAEGIRADKAVGFISNDQQLTWISPQHAGDQTMKIMRSLALSKAGSQQLSDLLRTSRDSFQHAASLIIITPDIGMDWWDPLIRLKSKGMIPTVLLLDPSSFGVDRDPSSLVRRLQNIGIPTYIIRAEMFADHLEVREEPQWEFRVFGTGQAIPVKKPADPSWKNLT